MARVCVGIDTMFVPLGSVLQSSDQQPGWPRAECCRCRVALVKLTVEASALGQEQLQDGRLHTVKPLFCTWASESARLGKGVIKQHL